MNRKIISMLVVLMFIATSSMVVMGQSFGIKTLDIKQASETNDQIKIPKADELCVLESITVDEVITLIKEQLHQIISNSRLRLLLMKCIENGISEMGEMGITSEKSLMETENIMSTGKFFNIKPRGIHRFMINIDPDAVLLSTTLPSREIDLTGDNESENKTLEIFVKLIPLLDSVSTEQRLIIRKLHQRTALLWPAIGARIIEGDETTFILAFGKGIYWSFRIF